MHRVQSARTPKLTRQAGVEACLAALPGQDAAAHRVDDQFQAALSACFEARGVPCRVRMRVCACGRGGRVGVGGGKMSFSLRLALRSFDAVFTLRSSRST
jgi:hypothetical protein